MLAKRGSEGCDNTSNQLDEVSIMYNKDKIRYLKGGHPLSGDEFIIISQWNDKRVYRGSIGFFKNTQVMGSRFGGDHEEGLFTDRYNNTVGNEIWSEVDRETAIRYIIEWMKR